MKYLLLLIVKTYWFLIPKSKRKKCIFKKSCSKYVYDITLKKGGIEGLKALTFRIKNCRNNFEIFKNPFNEKIQMILPNQQIIDKEHISNHLIQNYCSRENDICKIL